MKFKVGDIVVATKDTPYSITNTKMKKAEVISVTGEAIRVKVLDHKDKSWIGCSYPVMAKYFKLVNREQIIIYRKGDEVIALDKSTNKKGVAKCSPDDEFDFNIGAKLAFERLMNPIKIVKQDKYEVGDKVKIVDKWNAGTCENFGGLMDKWLGKTMTVSKVNTDDYFMEEDNCKWYWNDHCIEGKVINECEVKKAVKDKSKFKPGDIVKLVKGYDDIPKGTRGTFIKKCCDDTCVIDFHIEYKCTHDADCLKTKTGLWLYEREFEKVSE